MMMAAPPGKKSSVDTNVNVKPKTLQEDDDYGDDFDEFEDWNQIN